MTQNNDLFSAFEEQAESFANFFAARLEEETLDEGKEGLSQTDNLVITLLDGNEIVTADKLREELQNYEIDDETKGNLYLIYSEKMIYFLDENVSKLRLQRQRDISTARIEQRKKEKEESKKAKKSQKKRKQIDPEGEDFTVKKMTLEDMGKEMEQREEEEIKRKEDAEEEDKRVEGITERHSYGYQAAFSLYSDYIALLGKDRKGIKSLVDSVTKLGNKDLSVRQMAIDKILNETNLDLAYYPLVTSIKDKVIINKVIQALGRAGNFAIVGTLIEIFLDSYGEKGAGIRGLSAQSIGNTIQLLNKKEKLLGTKKLFSMIKKERFEKKLTSIIPPLKKDITNDKMRKYYYSTQCIQLLLMLCNKLMQLKQKEVKAAFLKFNVQTPLSKELKEMSQELQEALGK